MWDLTEGGLTTATQDVRDRVSKMSLEGILQSVYEMEDAMQLENQVGSWYFKMPFGIFGSSCTPSANIKICQAFKEYKTKLDELGALITKCSSEGWDDTDTRPISFISQCGAPETFTISLKNRLGRLVEAYDDAYEIVYRYTRSVRRATTPHAPPVMDPLSTCLRVTTLGDADEEGKSQLNTFQKLVFILLNKLQRQETKRYKSFCMEPIYSPGGSCTHAWRVRMDHGEPMTIEKFVYSCTPKESEIELWKLMTTRSNMANDLVNHLTRTRDIQFPEVRKERHMWSYRNGILRAKPVVEFMDYNRSQSLPESVATAKYFDQDFSVEWLKGDWWDIPTPNMQHILDHQQYDETVSRWVYAFLGRLCFDVGEIDDWQVIPFLKGLAGTGKSTLITKVAKLFYDAEDVKTMSNNIEKKFGLSSIMDAYMFVAPEIKGDIALDQAEFQSCISGEDVSVAVKNKAARSGNWVVPGIMAGNEVPNWKDNAGSILRRIVTFEFGTFVDEVDTCLGKKLHQEIGAILVKCLRAYHDKVQEVGHRAIWEVLPPYFLDIQKEMSENTSPVENFIKSEKVKVGRGLKIPKILWLQAFRAHCQENGLGSHKVTPDLWAGPFQRHGLFMRKLAEESYDGELYVQNDWVMGADLQAHQSQLAQGTLQI